MSVFYMIKIYLQTLVVSWKIYGFGRVFFAYLFGELFVRLFALVTLFLDKFFFRGYRKVEVKNPVFIIGHPRSGTTFLHHLLTSADNAAAFQTWHLLFPALTARMILKPLINYLIKTGRTELIPEETGHRVVLDKTEEEEMLFFHNYDTQFVPVGMLGFDDKEYPELQQHDQQPKSRRMKSMRFLDNCFKRHIHYTGKSQIVAQTHFSTHRLLTMMEYYPDAKFVYIVRDPLHVVPSFLSLLHKSIEFRCGIDPVPQPVLDRYNKRRYQSIIDLYRYFYDLQRGGKIPQERVLVLPYDMLLTDLVGAFAKIVEFTNIDVSEKLHGHVVERAKKQKEYHRKHQIMDLEHFGLTKEMIKQDFAFVYEEYGIDSDKSGSPKPFHPVESAASSSST